MAEQLARGDASTVAERICGLKETPIIPHRKDKDGVEHEICELYPHYEP